MDERMVDVAVIGAGQAGLSAAYHLQRVGFAAPDAVAGRRFVVFDGEDGPGGAWRHRWPSLRMATVNDIHDLPGIAQPEVDPCESSSDALTRYFGDYEQELGLPILRPIRVRRVARTDDDPRGTLEIETGHGTWTTRALVNATGTWTKPFWPHYPGQETFLGRQLHVATYRSAEEFRGQHVLVVGGGISAIQLLGEISRVTTTTWFTCREPQWNTEEWSSKLGAAAVARVEERVRQGLAPQSVVSVTGLPRTALVEEMEARGVLVRHPMFGSIEPAGVRMADGSFQPADAILWATGFRAALGHLAPLRLRGPGGGIVMDGTQVASEPRVHLVGYGPSASTVGANRAGRAAVRKIVSWLD